MMYDPSTKLKIDKEFKRLILPMISTEYKQLETQIKQNGCKDPIIIWKGFIIDGYEKYEICINNGIPFETKEMEFESRADVIVWICVKQLSRKTITHEMHKYLVGMQFEAEKQINQRKNIASVDQYTEQIARGQTNAQPPVLLTGIKTAQRLAEEYHIAYGTVNKYGTYAKAINILSERVSELATRILSGRCKISHESVIEISKMSGDDLREINRKLNSKKNPVFNYNISRTTTGGKKENSVQYALTIGGVKDMPAYDPDAEITRLALTVPSWIGSIERTDDNTTYNCITPEARKALLTQLINLNMATQKMIDKLKENLIL